MSLEEQKEQAIKLIRNPENVEELVAAVTTAESLVSYFASKGISISLQEAEQILSESKKYREKVFALPETELEKIAAGGTTVVINNNGRTRTDTFAEMATWSPREGLIFGSILTAIGVLITTVCAVDWKKQSDRSKSKRP